MIDEANTAISDEKKFQKGPMNPEIKDKWLKALRSGEYKQAFAVLKSTDGFCCLGVLCDIYLKEKSQKWQHKPFCPDGFFIEECSASLPHKIMEWSGIESSLAHYIVDRCNPERTTISLSNLNDNGVGFKEIADTIERHF